MLKVFHSSYLIFILLISFLLVSCSRIDPEEMVSNISSDRVVLDYSFDDIQLKGDSLTLLYYQVTFVYQSEDESFLFGYNNTVHALDIFSIDKKELNRRIFLDKDGPEVINRVFKIMILPDGSIIIMDGYKLWLLNRDGQALKQYSLVVTGEEELNGHFLNYNDANLGYLPEENAVLMHFIHNDESLSNFDARKLFPIVGKLNLDDGSIGFFPIAYPHYVQANYDKITEKMINLSYHNGLIFYGFPGHSNIYTYSILEKTFMEVGGKSKFSSNEEDFLLSKEHGDRLLGTWFNSVHFEAINQVYFRTHWGSQDLYQPDGSLSNANSKPGYLMIFDNRLGYVDELKVPNEYWLEDSFVANGAMYFWKKDAYITDENLVVLGRLNISLN